MVHPFASIWDRRLPNFAMGPHLGVLTLGIHIMYVGRLPLYTSPSHTQIKKYRIRT
ncbi:hypothetical protein V6Z11_A12G097900 [Gossypium hirsutum]